MKDLISIDLKSKQVSDAGGIRDRGFSLIELMVALAVSSIIMAAIYSVNATLTRSYTTQNVAADVQQAVRATIDFMAEDIMMAGLLDFRLDYAVDPEISAAGSSKISFNLDRDMDGDTDGKTPLPDVKDISENITYELIGNQLWITDDLGSEPLIDNVVNFEFRYFRENEDDTPTDNDVINGQDLINFYGLGDPLPEIDRDDIRTIQISITVEEPAGIGGPVERTYTTRVRCRNAGFF